MNSCTRCFEKSVKCPSIGCSSTKLFVLYILLFRTVLCENFCPKFAERPLETRVQDATIVFRAVVVQNHLETRTLDLALVSIYHGGLELATISQYGGSPYNTTDRQVNLKIRNSLVSCFSWGEDQLQKELVVFSRISDPAEDLHTTPPNGPWLEATSSAVPWSLGVDVAIWNAVGWADWGEWSPCSRTCGRGSQSLRRYCLKPPCEGFSEQKRKCNIFSCEGAVDPLAPSARRNFHPAQAKWKALADRPHAYSLRPNSYIWISSSELFPETNAFPTEFTLFVSLRLRPESGGHGQGTLFSLRSRRKNGAFLSLELAGRGVARLMHAGAGSSRAIYLAVPLFDFRWHQIAISVHDDRSVRIFVDCHWLRTDVLEKDALETPRDADLIIGYLFSGDLEQLVVVPEATVASEQCSSQITLATTSIMNGIVDVI